MVLASIILMAKSIYDIKKALIKKPGAELNTENLVYHFICYCSVFLIGTAMIV